MGPQNVNILGPWGPRILKFWGPGGPKMGGPYFHMTPALYGAVGGGLVCRPVQDGLLFALTQGLHF